MRVEGGGLGEQHVDLMLQVGDMRRVVGRRLVRAGGLLVCRGGLMRGRRVLRGGRGLLGGYSGLVRGCGGFLACGVLLGGGVELLLEAFGLRAVGLGLGVELPFAGRVRRALAGCGLVGLVGDMGLVR